MKIPIIIVTIVLILICVANSVAWVDASQDLRATQEAACYYYKEFAKANYQIEEAEDGIIELKYRVDTLKSRLEIANETVAELRDGNYKLRCINYELQEKTRLREFSSAEELKAWLAKDDTDSRLYFYGTIARIGGPYDCDDYAVNLVRHGHRDGFLISWELTDGWRHMINSTIIGNEIYFIDPQTDTVWLATYRDSD